MQVQRIVQRKMIPLTMALMTCVGVNTAKAAMKNDSFERVEPKQEVVTANTDEENNSSGFDWISFGMVLLVLGIIKLGSVVESLENKADKKAGEKAAKKAQGEEKGV